MSNGKSKSFMRWHTLHIAHCTLLIGHLGSTHRRFVGRGGKTWKDSCLELPQLVEGLLQFGDERGQFLAGLDRRVAGNIARLKQFVKPSEGFLGECAAPQFFFDDGFGDGGSREVQTLPELFLDQAKEQGEKLGRLTSLGENAQFLPAVAEALGDLALATQTRVSREGL